jgi:hypothetical protein
MNSSRQFTVILLGAATFFGAFTILNKARATHQLVKLREDIKPGTALELDHFEKVDVKGDDALLDGTVPWEKRSALVGMKPVKLLKGGSLLFRRDVPWQEAAPSALDLAPGKVSKTIEAPYSAIRTQPTPGDYVDVKLKPKDGVSSVPGQKFLGWSPVKIASNGEIERVAIFFEVDRGYTSPLDLPEINERVMNIEIIGKGK